jgi:tetratricopeptide (TPR) repeat protein
MVKDSAFRFKIILFVLAAILTVFFAVRDSLARFVWEKYNNAGAAYFLNWRDADLAMQIGYYYFGGSDYDLEKAEKAYEKALKIKPGILWGHYQLARIYFIKGDFNKAIEEINKELEYNPENLRSLYVRGLIFGYRGDLSNAEADFRRFTEWAPKEWAGYNDLAWILEKEEKYSDAEKTIQRAFSEIQDAKNNPWLWNSLGVAQLNLKEYKEAKVSFQKAKELAGKLTVNDWQRAYPGNNPENAESGLTAFRKAIAANIQAVEKHLR